jgi:hypothetical protein
MTRIGGFLVVVAAAAAVLFAPSTDAATACKRSPDAEQYPLLVQHGALRVYGTVGEGSYCYPWGMCPDHPLPLRQRDFAAANEALLAAGPRILTERRAPVRIRRVSISLPNDSDRDLMRRLCVGGEANGQERTLVARTGGDVFWLSHLRKGWVVWQRF